MGVAGWAGVSSAGDQAGEELGWGCSAPPAGEEQGERSAVTVQTSSEWPVRPSLLCLLSGVRVVAS